MTSQKDLERERSMPSQQAEMQKLFITGNLLRGADISAKHVHDFLVGLGEVCDMEIFNGPHVKTPNAYDAETFRRLGSRPPKDVNASVMWADSGSQLYIFPHKTNWFTLDIYSCKNFDIGRALQYAYDWMGVKPNMRYSISTSNGNTPWRQFTIPDDRVLDPESLYVPQIDQLFNIHHSDPNRVIMAGLALETLVVRAINEGHGNRVAASYMPEEVKQLQAIHGNYELAVDARFIDDVLSGKAITPDQYPLQPAYDRLSRMEAAAANMQRGSSVMHIGTGWPGTAIGLYRQFGIATTCVEKDATVAQRSEDALKRLGLWGESRLTVICADGCEINPEKYECVIVSAMVPEQDKISIIANMRRLATGTPYDPLLILRTPPDRARSLLYPALSDEVLGNNAIRLVAETAPFVNSEDPLKSLVYRVIETPEIRRGSDRLLMLARSRLKTPEAILNR